MKGLLLKIFRRSAEQAPVPEITPAPKPTPRKAAGKRKYGKRHHPAPKGMRRIDPSQPILQQVRDSNDGR